MDFSGLKNAKPSDKGIYLSPGEYDVEILKVQIIKTRGKGDAFVADFKVTAASEKLAEGQAANHPVGSTRNYYQGLADTDIAWPELKRFTYAVLGASTAEDKAKVDENIEKVFDAIDKGNTTVFTGKKAHASVVHRTTKLNKREIDALNWQVLGA